MFRNTKIEYLGFWVTQKGAKTINIKIEAITKIKPPTSQKKVHQFIGVANYFRDMCPKRLHTLAILPKITANKRNFKCTKIKQDYFDKIK